MERLATSEFRAASFAGYIKKKPYDMFLVSGSHGRGESTAGVSIRRADGREFRITQASGIVEALNDEAEKLGGQKIGEFVSLPSREISTEWYGVYEFSAEEFERSGLLD